MEKIRIEGKAKHKILAMAVKLYAQGYFSFLENSIEYVNQLRTFIHSIPVQKHYKTYNPKYGKFYCRYKPNQHTTYYITFDTQNDYFIVKNIITNHTPQYPRYIKGS